MHTHWRVSGQSFYLFTLSAHGGRTKSMRPPEGLASRGTAGGSNAHLLQIASARQAMDPHSRPAQLSHQLRQASAEARATSPTLGKVNCEPLKISEFAVTECALMRGAKDNPWGIVRF